MFKFCNEVTVSVNNIQFCACTKCDCKLIFWISRRLVHFDIELSINKQTDKEASVVYWSLWPRRSTTLIPPFQKSFVPTYLRD